MILEKEQAFMIDGPVGQLELMVHRASQEGALAALGLLAVICHPHPQHGGTMDNKVVTTLMRTYRDMGIHVVRFNFRSVGKSQGSFAHAIGEQDDLLAVLAWANNQWPEYGVLLAGFSFGSSVAAQVSYKFSVRHLTLVAPPVERYPYARDNTFGCPLCVIQGGEDERVNAEGLYAWAKTLSSPSELISYPKAGHFFHGYLSELKADLTQVLLRQLE
jgi:alpha/beta superfamily hydrolase